MWCGGGGGCWRGEEGGDRWGGLVEEGGIGCVLLILGTRGPSLLPSQCMWQVWRIYIIQARSCDASDPCPPGAPTTPEVKTNVALLRATAAKYEIFSSILAGSIGQITQQRPLLATSKSCLVSPWRTAWPVYVGYFLPFCKGYFNVYLLFVWAQIEDYKLVWRLFFFAQRFIWKCIECNIDVCDCIVAFDVRLGVNLHSMIG